MDRLEIAIEAQARDANRELNALYSTLGNIANALNRSASGYRNTARELGRVTAALRTLASIKIPNFSNLNSISRLAKIDPTGLANMANAIQSLGSMDDAAAGINRMVNSLTRLAQASNMASTTNSLPAFVWSIQNAFTALSSVDMNGAAVQAMSAISRLANAGGSMGTAAANLPALTSAVVDFFNAMSQAPVIDDNAVRMTRALATLATNGDRVGDMTLNVNHGMHRMADGTNQANQAFENMRRVLSRVLGGLTSFAQVVARAQVAALKFGAAVVTGFRGIGSSAKGLNQATLSLKNLLSVALGFYGIRTLFNWGKDAMELSSGLVEVQNVVENAFGESGTEAVENFVKSSITQFGMAELTAKKVASRYQAMGKSMGITAQQIESANARIGSRLSKEYQQAEEGAASMSLNLTRLAADMASFYNVEQETVAEALNAVYTGQTRPLRQYGIDLTQATLQEWAQKQGIDAKMDSMTQAEKTMLRYQYVLSQTTMIQGDFTRTYMTWANQIRILKQNFEMLGKTIGNILTNTFRPLIMWMNNAIGKVIEFAETVGNALGKIFGWTIMHTPAGSTNDSLEEMSDGLDGVSDSAGDVTKNVNAAEKAVEDLQNTVLGFDELNKLAEPTKDNSPSGQGTGSGAGASPSTGAVGEASGADFNLVRTKNLFEAYKSEIDSLFELGDYIGRTLTEALNSIDWDKVYMSAKKFGIGLASFLNGLISPELFGAVGRSIANSLNTALHFLDSFGSTFSWKNFGQSLGVGIQSFFKNYDWGLTAHTFYTFVNGFATAFNAAIDEINTLEIGNNIASMIEKGLGGIKWETIFDSMANFGYKLAQFLNGVINPSTFSVIGKTVANSLHAALLYLNNFGATFDFAEFGNSIAAGINTFFDTFSFDQAARTINTWMIGVLTTAREMIGGLNWKSIGAKIGLALKDIDWEGAFKEAKDLLAAALNGFVDFAKGLFDPSGLGTPFTDALDRIVDASKKFVKAVDWEMLVTNVQKFISALSPIAKGFAEGFVEVFEALAKIGGTAINWIGIGFGVMADGLNKLDPKFLESIGKALGIIATSLFSINLVRGAITALTGLGAAGAAAAGGTAAAAGGATGLGNAVAAASGFILTRALPAVTGFVGTMEALKITTGESDDEVESLNETFKYLPEGVNPATASFEELKAAEKAMNEEMGRSMLSVDASTISYDALRDATESLTNKFGLTSGQVNQLTQVLWQNELRGKDTAESYNQLVDLLGNMTGGSQEAQNALVNYLNSALQETGETATGAAESMEGLKTTVSNSTITYDSLRNALSGLSGQYGLTKTDMDVLYSSLAMQESAGTEASTAYTNLQNALSLITGGSQDASRALSNELAASLLGTSTSAEDAKEKSALFQSGLWGMAGGMAAKALLMAVMGSTFKGMGDKAETAGPQVEGLEGNIKDLSNNISNYAATARTNSETMGENIPKGMASGIETKEFMVNNAIANMTNDAISKSATLLDAHSPSRVFAGMGGDVDTGFANGITNMAGYVLTAIKNMVNPLITEVETFASTMEKRGQDAVNSFRSSFENADLSGIVNNMIAGIDWNGLNNSLYNFGYNASMSLANGFRAVRMPSLQYYVSAWDYHDLGNGGWSYTPRLSPWWYARGGFPNMGELFVANEAGPEMVGRMGNKNVVANNLQITEGIKAAVVEGMMQVAMATKSDDSSVPYVINMRVVTDDDETLARRVARGQMRRDSRYNVLAVR